MRAVAWRWLAPLAAAALATAVLPDGASAAGVTQGVVVSAVPSLPTPNLAGGTVLDLAQASGQIFAGGTFTTAEPPGDTAVADQVPTPYVASWTAATGTLVTTFRPVLDGAVLAIAAGPIPGTVYLAGQFHHVDGVAQTGVALVSAMTGARVASFTPPVMPAGSEVDGVALVGTHLLLAGVFSALGSTAAGGLASINATSGAVDRYLNVVLSGHHNYRGQNAAGCGTTGHPKCVADAPVGGRAIDVAPGGTRAVVLGNFTHAGALARDQILMLDLAATSAGVDAWNTDAFTAGCNANAYDTYVRGVSYSPSGTSFAVVSTGAAGTTMVNTDGTHALCDGAALFPATPAPDVLPTWVDLTGNDSLLSVAVTDTAVYVGGHQRWLNNPRGVDYAGPGAVVRPGIAALDPVNGLPLAWDPGRNPRGDGAYALLATAQGLYVGSDQDWIGSYTAPSTSYYRGLVAGFPVAGGSAPTVPTTAALPADAFLAGSLPATGAATNVLYRVVAGGPGLAASDDGPNWLPDTATPGLTVSGVQAPGCTATASYPPVTTVNASVPAGAPWALFETQRLSCGGSAGMTYTFAVPSGTPVNLRLYFANQCTCTAKAGQRVFNVSVDGQPSLVNYDAVAVVGNEVGEAVTVPATVPASGQLTVTFTPVSGANPMVSALEVVRSDEATPPDSPYAALTTRYMTGGGPTPAAVAPAAAVAQPRVAPAPPPAPSASATPKVTPAPSPTATPGPTAGPTPGPSSGGAPTRPVTGPPSYGNPGPVRTPTAPRSSASAPGGFDWSQVRGAVLVGGTLYFGWTDGQLYSAHFDGDTVSGVAVVDPYLDPRWDTTQTGSGCGKGICTPDYTGAPPTLYGAEMQQVTGMVAAGGRLYYTLYGSPVLHWRAFEPGAGDGILGALEGQQATPTDPTLADVSGMFLSGSTLYYGDRVDGTLHTVAFANGAPAASSEQVVSGPSIDGLNWASRAMFTMAVPAPTASFAPSCVALGCTFDASASTALGSSVASYTWDFGDGSQGSGVAPAHVYAAPGTYPVTLTVTSTLGDSAQTSQTVTAAPPPATPISFVDQSVATGYAAAESVTVPPDVSAGDGMLLIATGAAPGAITAPAGWAAVGSVTTAQLTSTVWQRVATTADPNSVVSVQFAGTYKGTLVLTAYAGTAPSGPVDGTLAASWVTSQSGAAVSTPGLSGLANSGDWVVSYWAAKSSTVGALTPPAGVTQRAAVADPGLGRVTAVVADSAAAVPAGSAPGLVASADNPASGGVGWSLALAP